MFRKLLALVAIAMIINISHSVAINEVSADFSTRRAAYVTPQFDPPEPEAPPGRR